MAGKQTKKKKVKLEVRSAPMMLKVVLIVLILCFTGTLAALRWVHSEIRQQTDLLKTEAAAVENANQELEGKSTDVDSVSAVKQIAQNELGMVEPDTVLIDPQS